MVKPNSQNEESTRQKILSAARQEFIENGLRGARMQEIADRAGINKALLHYHFRDKEYLYKAAVESVAEGMMVKMVPVFENAEDRTIDDVIQAMVRAYLMALRENPEFAGMALREMSDGGKHLDALMGRITPLVLQISGGLFSKLEKEKGSGETPIIPVPHLIINMMSMIWGTFLLRPLYQRILPIAGFEMLMDDAFFEDRVKSISIMMKGCLLAGGRK